MRERETKLLGLLVLWPQTKINSVFTKIHTTIFDVLQTGGVSLRQREAGGQQEQRRLQQRIHLQTLKIIKSIVNFAATNES